MISRFRFPVLCALTSSIALSAPSSAQTTNRAAPVRPRAAAPAPLSPANLASILANAERSQQSDSLLLAYGQAVTDPTLARVAIGQLLSNYYQLRNQAQTADQATQAVAEAGLRFQVLQSAQNQVLIQQNQQILQQNARVIALLEQSRTAR